MAILHVLLGIAAFTSATPAPSPQFPVPKGDGTNGSGPLGAKYAVDPGLKGFTFYAPIKPPTEKVPILLWANGMCMDQGLGFRNLLNEIASYGYVVVANGAPEGTGKSSDQKMLQSLEYVSKNAGTGTGPLQYADNTRIAAAGQSCGGWQAYKASGDKRIKATGIFDSGGNSAQYLKTLHSPIAYFLGGTGDMAFRPGTSDYNSLPAGVPALYVNNPKGGHMQDMMNKSGGLVAVAGRAFLDWVLKNSTEGKEMFTSKTSKILSAGWQVKMKDFK